MRIFIANKFEWVKQHDSMQCGVSCLAMICRHYGKNHSIEYLDRFCHANISGVSMLGIADGARSIGLNTVTVAASTDELKPLFFHVFFTGIRTISSFFMVSQNTENTTKLQIQEKG